MPARKRKPAEAGDGSYAGNVLAAYDQLVAAARDDDRCLLCAVDLDAPSAAGAEDGICGQCIGDSAAQMRASGPFIDFDAYIEARYSPPPQLVALAAIDPFWRTLGGSIDDAWGDAGETVRQRREALS